MDNMKEEIRKVMSFIGSIKTERKSNASRRNGKSGGRPPGKETRKKILG